MRGRSRKRIKMDNEKSYAKMAGHPPDSKATQDMNHKPYQNVDVLGYLQKKYAIPEEKKNE